MSVMTEEELHADTKKSIVGIKPQPKCRHVHVSKQSKTDGTPYIKGWCEMCKAWVYTEQRYCICCRGYVKHKTHHLHLKRIMNEALKIHSATVDEYKIFPYRDLTFVEVIFQKRKYHIPLKYLALYDEHPIKSEILPLVQDYICTVRG